MTTIACDGLVARVADSCREEANHERRKFYPSLLCGLLVRGGDERQLAAGWLEAWKLGAARHLATGFGEAAGLTRSYSAYKQLTTRTWEATYLPLQAQGWKSCTAIDTSIDNDSMGCTCNVRIDAIRNVHV